MNDYDEIPSHMMQGMKAYVELGRPNGSFLTAAFANDFISAACKADSTNVKILRLYAMWVHWECPDECKGSYEKVAAWTKKKQLEMEEAE